MENRSFVSLFVQHLCFIQKNEDTNDIQINTNWIMQILP